MISPDVRPSLRGKYSIVAAHLNRRTGSVLDVGARDGILGSRLKNPGLTYRTADRAPGSEIAVDLNRALDIPDRAYDHVVALDVLEHIDDMHAAFRELARIAAVNLIIALPHMGNWRQRTAFLLTGSFATRKYDLMPTPTPDRHRWFTIRDECDEFIACMARTCGWNLDSVVRELEGAVWFRAAAFLPVRMDLGANLLTGRSIYFLERTAS